MGLPPKYLWILLIINLPIFFYFLLTDSYPGVLVFTHFLTLILLVFWAAFNENFFKDIKSKYVDIIIIFIIFFIALGIRLYKIEEVTPGMWGDEIVMAQAGEKLVESKSFLPFVPDNYGHPSPFLYLTGWITKTFTRSLTSVRFASVLFGALDVSLIYIFLRLFFGKELAILGSLVMTFTYSHLIVSRFAYEMTPAIFFEILAFIFLYLIFKSQEIKKYALFGFILAGGLYTYLGFRTMAFILLLIAIFISASLKLKDRLKKITILIIFLAVGLIPLISYSIRHPDQIIARTKSVSVFNQNLSQVETIKEIMGSAKRSFGMFVFYGDPNPRQNPSGKVIFDPLTSLLALVGLVFLFVKNRKLFFICLIALVPPFVNDIFSAEFFPEFHYYGTGHPNTLRVAGLIPIIIFLAVYGINILQGKVAGISHYSKYFAFIIVAIVCLINFNWYYSQPYSDFNYYINGMPQLKIIDYIKKNNFNEVAMTKELSEDTRIQYFIPKTTKLSAFTPDEKKDLEQIPKGMPLFIDSKVDPNFIQLLTNRADMSKYGVLVETINDPLKRVETVVIFHN